MTNVLNSQIMNNYNTIPVRKISPETRGSRYIEAPVCLPEYSIQDELKKKEELRKNVMQQQYAELFKNKKKFPSKIIFILAAIAGVFFLKKKI